MVKLKDLHWNKCVAVCLAAFLTPVGHIFVIGGNTMAAARMGVGAAIIAFLAFIQDPTKGN